MKQHLEKLHQIRFEILFFSFMFLMFYSLIFPHLSFSMAMLVNVFAGLNLFPKRKKKKIVPLTISLTLIIMAFVGAFVPGAVFKSLAFLFFVIFFLFVTWELFHQIYKSPKVSTGIIYALLCGVIILGFLGSLMFLIIEISASGSFSNLSEGPQRVNELVYFSFMTLLTIGYGDIVPVSSLAQRVTTLFGVIGHFYSVVVVAIVIGKYLGNSMGKEE